MHSAVSVRLLHKLILLSALLSQNRLTLGLASLLPSRIPAQPRRPHDFTRSNITSSTATTTTKLQPVCRRHDRHRRHPHHHHQLNSIIIYYIIYIYIYE